MVYCYIRYTICRNGFSATGYISLSHSLNQLVCFFYLFENKMEFFVYETQQLVKAKVRPIVIITSNNEKDLPDAFLRRCFFHYIQFPDSEQMQQIVDVHFPNIKPKLLEQALVRFFEMRNVNGIKKKPSTSELLDWLKLLLAEDIAPEVLRDKQHDESIMPLYGALLKNEQDMSLFEKIAFLARRQQ